MAVVGGKAADGVDGCRSRHLGSKVVVVINHEQEEPSTMNISTIGLDLAKNVFQVHGIDDTGQVIVHWSPRLFQEMAHRIGALHDGRDVWFGR